MTQKQRRLGRIELLSWVNSAIDADYARIEDLSDGIAYCQIVDALYPGKIALHKLVFDPKRPEDRLANLQAFADALRAAGVMKAIPPLPRLAAGKFADHAELLQDMYDLVSRTNPALSSTYCGYDVRAAAAARAEKARGGKLLFQLPPHLIPNRVVLHTDFSMPMAGTGAGAPPSSQQQQQQQQPPPPWSVREAGSVLSGRTALAGAGGGASAGAVLPLVEPAAIAAPPPPPPPPPPPLVSRAAPQPSPRDDPARAAAADVPGVGSAYVRRLLQQRAAAGGVAAAPPSVPGPPAPAERAAPAAALPARAGGEMATEFASGGGASGTGAAAGAAAGMGGGTGSASAYEPQVYRRTREPTDAETERATQERRTHAAQMAALVSELERELAERLRRALLLGRTVNRVRAERDFYFDKLRAIEAVCDVYSNYPAAISVSNIVAEVPLMFQTEAPTGRPARGRAPHGHGDAELEEDYE